MQQGMIFIYNESHFKNKHSSIFLFQHESAKTKLTCVGTRYFVQIASWVKFETKMSNQSSKDKNKLTDGEILILKAFFV